MMIIRSQTTRCTPILRKFVTLRSDSRSNAANLLAWGYRSRANNNNSDCWRSLRPRHFYAGSSFQPIDNDDSANIKCPHGFIGINGLSARYLSSSTSCMHLFPGATTQTLFGMCAVRGDSRISSVYFSTMDHSTSTNSNGKVGEQDQTKDANLTASQKARILFKKYGSVFVGTYFGVYFTTLFSFFVTLDSGLLDPDTLSQIFKVSKDMACETADIIGPTGSGASMNEAADAYADEVTTEISKDKRTLVDIITGYLLSWEWTSRYSEKLSENPHLTNLAVAWFLVKFTEPFRLAASILLTPKVAQALGREKAKSEAQKST
ncbi:hypothetical protein ACHAWF_014146 [Thalassiosira exigua]